MHKRATRDRLVADLRAVVQDAEALLEATSSESGEKMENLRARVQQSMHQARERIARVEAEAVEHARKAADTAEAFVQDNPWQAIGAAAGIGLALGLLINRR